MLALRRPVVSLLALLALGSFPSCAALPTIDAGVCGNGVVDPATEDCDGVAGPSGASCRPPGGDHPCRLEAAMASQCPGGWGRGLDGICRQATGRFAASPGQAADARQVLLGDFDGSGALGVLALGQAQTSLLFFDSHGQLADSLAQPAQYSGAVVGSFSAGADGLAYLRAEGVGVVLGQTDRTLQRQSYPLLSFGGAGLRIAAVRTVPLAAAFDPNGEQIVVVGPAATDDPANPLAYALIRSVDHVLYSYLPGSPADLVGEPVRGPLLSPGSHCDSIAVALSADAFPQGGARVLVVPLCRPSADGKSFFENVSDQNPPNGKGGRTGFVPDANGTLTIPYLPWKDGLDGQVSVALPGGYAPSPDAPLLLVDIDGDGALDLLLGAVGPGDPADTVLAAYADGKGGYVSSRSAGAAPNAAAPLLADQALSASHGRLRAAADLDGDGRLDVVMSDGVYLSGVVGAFGSASPGALDGGGLAPPGPGGPLERPAAYGPVHGSWKSVQIADFSGNGSLDVIAAGDADVGLDYFEGAGGGLLNRTFLPTSALVSGLTVGDFDGDRLLDVAYGAHPSGSSDACSPGDPVSVRFGQPLAPPLAEVQVGALGCIKQIASARVTVLGAAARDAVSALAVIYDPSTSGDSHRVAILRGDGNRELTSPFGLQLAGGYAPSRPRLLAAGDFAGGAGSDLCAAADAGADHRLWMLRFGAGGDIDGAAPSSTLVMNPQVLAAGKIGGSGGRDAVLALGPCVSCDVKGTDVALIFRPQMAPLDPGSAGDPAPALRFVADPGGPHPLPAPVPPASAATATDGPVPPPQAGIADLDGDGQNDVAMLLGGTLYIAWSNGGVIDWDHPLQLSAADPALASVEGGKARFGSFAFLNADGDAASELALRMVTGTDPLVVLDLARRSPALRVLPGLAGRYALAAGDVNGDGVDDLVVGYPARDAPGRVFVYLGAPTLP